MHRREHDVHDHAADDVDGRRNVRVRRLPVQLGALRRRAAYSVLLVSLAAGCGGGGGGGASTPAVTAPAASPANVTPAPLVTTFPITQNGTLTEPFPTYAGGYTGQLVAQQVLLTSATMQSALSIGAPPALSQAVNAPKPVVAYAGSNGTTPTVLSYAELTPSNDLTVNGAVTLTFGYPPGTLDPKYPYLYAFWFGQLTGVSWIDGYNVSTVDFTAQTVTISGTPAAFNFNQFRGGFIYGFAIYHN